MKKILLLGDSVRMGYDRYVKERMAKATDVYYPSVNCMYSTNILRFLHCWTDDLKLYEADAVHFNAGLWDTLRIYGDEPLVSPDTYADNLERIAERIRYLFPNAKILFATSTPVIESGYINGFEMRYNRDIEEYNRIACDVLKKHHVIINDLYALLRDVPEEYHSDQTHFYTADATVLIGKQVTGMLCKALNIDETLMITPDPQEYHCPERGIPDKDAYIPMGHIYVQK